MRVDHADALSGSCRRCVRHGIRVVAYRLGMRRALLIVAATVVVAAWMSPVQAATTPTGAGSAPHGSAPSTTVVAGASAVSVSGPLTSASAESVAGARTVVPRASAKGRKGQTLTVTPTTRLAAYGQTVRVKGRGFSELVGIYVGLCVMPRVGAKPTPCGGGADEDGSSQASAWISSNPPPYGARLAIPYKPGGKFSVRIKISPRIGSIDCRTVRCAVVARADHTRAFDRTWDVVVPVTFR